MAIQCSINNDTIKSKMEYNMSTSVGSTVRLKSGGPSMTVKEVMGTLVRVQWFDGSTLKEDVVSISTLALSETVNEQQILLG
jgi:uncharacterized protein YodC (DUF2158 family)